MRMNRFFPLVAFGTALGCAVVMAQALNAFGAAAQQTGEPGSDAAKAVGHGTQKAADATANGTKKA